MAEDFFHHGALVTRQQFLPGLQEVDGQWLARWDAVFAGGEADRLAKLVQAMPPSAAR